MAYRFTSDEAVASGIRRCAAEQLDDAIAELTERVGHDPVGAVHAARKAVKKERSLLRLARGAMDPAQRRRENAALRHAAQGLSAARDAEVMIETLDDLAARYAGQLPKSAFEQIRDRIEQRRDRERGELVGSVVADRAADELHAVRTRQTGWEFSRDGWDAVQTGLRRSYRDGRELFARARSEPSAFGDWHEWRKRVKDLWYQQRLLAPVAGATVSGQAKEAHELADLLGDEHDLGVLQAMLQNEEMRPPVDLDAVLELIDRRRREIQADAVVLGGRIYAESPKRFIRRMRRSWEAGAARARLTPRGRPPAARA